MTAAAQIVVFRATRLVVPSFQWRLRAANRRPLLHSVAAFRNEESCVLDAMSVRQGADPAVARAVMTPAGRWRWVLLVDEAVRAASVVEFDRRAECARAAESGIRAFRGATILLGAKAPRPGTEPIKH